MSQETSHKSATSSKSDIYAADFNSLSTNVGSEIQINSDFVNEANEKTINSMTSNGIDDKTKKKLSSQRFKQLALNKESGEIGKQDDENGEIDGIDEEEKENAERIARIEKMIADESVFAVNDNVSAGLQKGSDNDSNRLSPGEPRVGSKWPNSLNPEAGSASSETFSLHSLMEEVSKATEFMPKQKTSVLQNPEELSSETTIYSNEDELDVGGRTSATEPEQNIRRKRRYVIRNKDRVRGREVKTDEEFAEILIKKLSLLERIYYKLFLGYDYEKQKLPEPIVFKVNLKKDTYIIMNKSYVANGPTILDLSAVIEPKLDHKLSQPNDGASKNSAAGISSVIINKKTNAPNPKKRPYLSSSLRGKNKESNSVFETDSEEGETDVDGIGGDLDTSLIDASPSPSFERDNYDELIKSITLDEILIIVKQKTIFPPHFFELRIIRKAADGLPRKPIVFIVNCQKKTICGRVTSQHKLCLRNTRCQRKHVQLADNSIITDADFNSPQLKSLHVFFSLGISLLASFKSNMMLTAEMKSIYIEKHYTIFEINAFLWGIKWFGWGAWRNIAFFMNYNLPSKNYIFTDSIAERIALHLETKYESIKAAFAEMKMPANKKSTAEQNSMFFNYLSWNSGITIQNEIEVDNESRPTLDWSNVRVIQPIRDRQLTASTANSVRNNPISNQHLPPIDDLNNTSATHERLAVFSSNAARDAIVVDGQENVSDTAATETLGGENIVNKEKEGDTINNSSAQNASVLNEKSDKDYRFGCCLVQSDDCLLNSEFRGQKLILECYPKEIVLNVLKAVKRARPGTYLDITNDYKEISSREYKKLSQSIVLSDDSGPKNKILWEIMEKRTQEQFNVLKSFMANRQPNKEITSRLIATVRKQCKDPEPLKDALRSVLRRMAKRDHLYYLNKLNKYRLNSDNCAILLVPAGSGDFL